MAKTKMIFNGRGYVAVQRTFGDWLDDRPMLCGVVVAIAVVVVLCVRM